MKQNLKEAVLDFLDLVCEKHKIKSYDDFQVEQLRTLAEAVNYFG